MHCDGQIKRTDSVGSVHTGSSSSGAVRCRVARGSGVNASSNLMISVFDLSVAVCVVEMWKSLNFVNVYTKQ